MKEIRWQAPEFEYQHRRHSWYLWVILIAGIIIVISILQQNFLFAVFSLLATILVVRLGSQTPKYLDFELTEEALIIGSQKVYAYDQFSGFATRRLDTLADGLSELIFQRKHRLGAYLKVIFPTQRVEEIRHFVNRHLPEIEYEDTLSEHLSRWLKL